MRSRAGRRDWWCGAPVAVPGLALMRVERTCPAANKAGPALIQLIAAEAGGGDGRACGQENRRTAERADPAVPLEGAVAVHVAETIVTADDVVCRRQHDRILRARTRVSLVVRSL